MSTSSYFVIYKKTTEDLIFFDVKSLLYWNWSRRINDIRQLILKRRRQSLLQIKTKKISNVNKVCRYLER